MGQRADHPHQAAVHLMKALKCCKDCYDVSQTDYAELGQLQFEKDLLAKQLAEMGNPEQDLERIKGQVHDLEYLIAKVKQENQIAYQTGMRQVEAAIHDRQIFEQEHQQGYQIELIAEKDKHRALTLQIEKVMEKIRYLHRINEELVSKFCQY